jgi:hypothetical protein
MLDRSADKLMEEIDASEDFRRRHTAGPEKVRETLAGHSFDSGIHMDAALENTAFEYLSLVAPKWVFNNPTSRLTMPEFPEEDRLVTEWELNKWTKDVDLRTELLKLAFDAACGWGNYIVVREPLPGYDPSEPDSPFRPRIYRISWDDLGFDYRAKSFDRARFSYRRRVVDRNHLLVLAEEEEGWKKDAIESLVADSGGTKYTGTGNARREPKTTKRADDEFFEIWIPEANSNDPGLEDHPGPEHGFHGAIYTVAQKGDEAGVGLELRKPMPFFGPPWGPHGMVHAGYIVSDDPYPLNALVANQRQHDRLNEVVDATFTAMAHYKQIFLVDTETNIGNVIAAGKDKFVYKVENLDAAASKAVEIAGITNQHIQQLTISRAIRDRNIGISDSRRGEKTGGSATEADLTAGVAATREAFQSNMFTTGIERALATVVWYMVNDLNFVDENLTTPDGQRGLYEGRPSEEQPITNNVSVEIEVWSMRHVDEATMQRNAQMTMNVLTQVAELARAYPEIDWQGVLGDFGRAYGNPELAKRFNPDIAATMLNLQIMTGQIPTPSGGGGGGVGGTAPGSVRDVSDGSGLAGYRSGAVLAAETKATSSPQ